MQLPWFFFFHCLYGKSFTISKPWCSILPRLLKYFWLFGHFTPTSFRLSVMLAVVYSKLPCFSCRGSLFFMQPCQFLRVYLTIFFMFFHFRIVDHIRRGHSALTRILGFRLSEVLWKQLQLLPWMVTALLRNSEQSKHICLRLKFSFVWIICGLTFRCRKWFLYFVQADLFVHVVSHL